MSPRGTGRRATGKPVIVLAGEDSNDRRCMQTVVEALSPDAKGRTIEINKQPRLRLATNDLTSRVDTLTRLAEAKGDRRLGSLITPAWSAPR